MLTPSGIPITYNLTNVTSSNSDTHSQGGIYTTTLTATDNTFTIWTASVTMGGVDITSTAYSNGAVTITNVTDAVVITASASLLPTGYTRLKYILNSNRTYIDTGVYPASTDHIIINYGLLTGGTGKDRFLFGTKDANPKRLWADCYHYNNAYVGGSIYPRFGTQAPNSYKYTKGTVEIKNKIWSFPGTNNTWDGSAESDFTCDNTCCLFGRRSTTDYDSRDMYISRFYIEGKFDGYAALNTNNEAVLYDIVSKSDFKSPDNIAFVAGANY